MNNDRQQGQEALVDMAKAAWEVRSHAYILGNTRVGAAALSSDGAIFVG